jgi:hypothetical protein
MHVATCDKHIFIFLVEFEILILEGCEEASNNITNVN